MLFGRWRRWPQSDLAVSAVMVIDGFSPVAVVAIVVVVRCGTSRDVRTRNVRIRNAHKQCVLSYRVQFHLFGRSVVGCFVNDPVDGMMECIFRI